jgi:malate dehydrogenase (oxaloacetate-decarboxylating)
METTSLDSTAHSPTAPSHSYSLSLRVEYANEAGMLGLVTSAIGGLGGDIGAVDIVHVEARAAHQHTITRDITFAAIDRAHAMQIIQAVRELANVDVVSVVDRTFLSHVGGKVEIRGKVPVKTRDDLARVYVPGVARIAEAIVENPEDGWNLSGRKNSVAIISNGSELLGLGNAGPSAALPVMEAKSLLFKEFAKIDAFPLCLNAPDAASLIAAVRALEPSFGAVHLEDIASPACFEVEEELGQVLGIPVFHNDQHGTAIVVLAALINALKLSGKAKEELKIAIHGTGAAGLATARLLTEWGVRDITLCQQRHGERGRVLHAELAGEFEGHGVLQVLARSTNPRGVRGDLRDALRDADVFVGFGRRTILEASDLTAMAPDAVVLMMAYPHPEVDLGAALRVARVVGSGRSDFPNQISNMLAFPGFFRGLLDAREAPGAKNFPVTVAMKLAAAHAIADVVGRDELHDDYIVPSVFDRRVTPAVAAAVVRAATE